jgi:hypothetical protein
MKRKSVKMDSIPYNIIVDATAGDVDALHFVLRVCDSYMEEVSTRKVFDGYGVRKLSYHSELKGILINKVINSVGLFDATGEIGLSDPKKD